MCNLYSVTKGQSAIRDFAQAMRDTTGNLPRISGVFPDYAALHGFVGLCEVSKRGRGRFSVR